jgi:hypothetical protein
MQQLEKRMLAIGAGLTPENGSSIVIHRFTVEAGGFAIALHIQLLKVGGQQQQALAIGYNRRGLQLEEIAVPDAQQRHNHWHIALQRRLLEVVSIS